MCFVENSNDIKTATQKKTCPYRSFYYWGGYEYWNIGIREGGCIFFSKLNKRGGGIWASWVENFSKINKRGGRLFDTLE